MTGERDPAGVRPYALTGGRTRAGSELAVEALVSTTPAGQAMLPGLRLERHAIARLCLAPLAVAEVAARLDVPLGVARVLVAVGQPLGGRPGDRPGPALLERVLEGLRAL